MALQSLAGGVLRLGGFAPWMFTATSNITNDAVGESIALIGHVFLSSGPGTTKTFSSSGGKIHWRHGGTATWADAGSTLRVGVQDVGATGLEDGTHDVYGEIIGNATPPITANAVNTIAMSSGSKSITHGDQIAIVLEITARGGSDSLVHVAYGVNGVMPYRTADTGAGPAIDRQAPLIAIETDDGTIGFLGMDTYPAFFETATAYGTSSTPDEYAIVFQVPFKAAAVGLYAQLGNLSTTDDFDMILYSDPLGTPVAERTVSQDLSLAAFNSAVHWERPFTSAYTLSPNTNYGVALRPTTTNTLSFNQMNFGSSGANLRKALPFGTNISRYQRSDQTGAFGSQSTVLIPCFGVLLGQLSDDVGSGSGGAGGYGAWWVR